MPERNQSFTARAHAKLNLSLAVGAAVDDPGASHHGYHPICSYMHAIELADSVGIERLADGEMSRFDLAWSDQDLGDRAVEWDTQSDLVFRAHSALERETGLKLPCAITVRKSIPAGGGLGGGSSDAACVLTGLDRVFSLGLGPAGLLPVAMSLGSDLGFFLDDRSPPRPAVVSGFGDTIERLEPVYSGTVVTLILPPFGCDTRAVYREFDQLPDHTDEFTYRSSRVRDLPVARSLHSHRFQNDLFDAAVVVRPELRAMSSLIADRIGSAVLLTGSGSTLFVLGPVEASLIHEVSPDCRVVRTRLV